MIKKALLVICLMIAPNLAIANVFSDALNFICGGGSVTETWNNNGGRNYDKTPYCPPYNKWGNRGGCLKQYTAPGLGTLFYLQYCAEEAPSSSYFNPKIQVRMQSCNPIACWAMSSELNWDGECVQWPTPFLFPLQRLCARMAAPADNTATPTTPADDGYTYFKHLNFEGAVVDDPRIPGTDGQSVFIVSPKTCAYWDPWAFDLFPVMPLSAIPFFDIFDYNPMKQPFHKSAGVHPIVQMMISLLEAGLNSSQMILQLITSIEEAAMGPMGLLVKFIGDKTGLTKMIIDMVSSCIKIVGEEVFVRILKEFGQLNHVVYDDNIGCVPVPMGPFPPPYPPQYASAPPSPTIEPVCASTAGYTINVTSTASNFVPPATVVAPSPPTPPAGATLLSNNGTTDANGNTTYAFLVHNSDGSTKTTTSVTPGFIASSSTSKCATSTYSNNAINNVVRVGIDRILPRCDLASLSSSNTASANTSTTTVAANSCVNISGSISAKATASNPAGIPSCPNSSGACVQSTTPAVCAPTVCGPANTSASPNTCTAAPAASAKCPATSCGYRVIYATQYVAGATPLSNPYYDPTLPDCNGATYPCQVIWGVNAGPYTDLIVPFPPTEESSTESTQTLANINPSTTSTTFCYNGQSYSFVAAISRIAGTPTTIAYPSTPNTVGSYPYPSVAASGTGISSQDPTKICIYTATDPSISQAGGGGGTPPTWTLSTCLPRAPVPTPKIVSCCQPGVTTNCSSSCQSSNFAPAMVVELAVGSYSTQGVLAANAFAANPSYATTLNLAGYEYTATVTDNTFITPDNFSAVQNTAITSGLPPSCGINPSNFLTSGRSGDFVKFSYTPAPNNGTFFGTLGSNGTNSNYLPARAGAACPGAVMPFYITNPSNPPSSSSDHVLETGAIYRSGLVYVNNKYLVGGSYMCLSALTQNTCATNVNNCVLASLQNTAFFDCPTFNTKVLGAYPNITYCGSTVDSTCQQLGTVSSSNGNIVTIYQCGSTTTSPPINPYKCYAYNSSTTTGALCATSLDPAQRITPAPPNPVGSSPILATNQYYDPNTNQGSVQGTMTNAGTNTPPVVQDCGSYLNNVVDLNNPTSNPYVGIPQCGVTNPSTAGNATPLCTGSAAVVGTPPNPMPGNMCYNSSLQLPVCSTSAPIIESFTSTLSTSPSSSVRLDIHNCYSSYQTTTGTTVQQNNYCYNPTYTPASTTATCQINTTSVARITTSGNPAVGSSTLGCSSFIYLFGNSNPVSLISNSPYTNIAACASPPPGSVTTTLTDSSASPALLVDIYQYATTVTSTSTVPVLAPPAKQLNYCYNPRTAPSGGSCSLNRTSTTVSRPNTMDCYTLLTLIDANYQNIIPCATTPVTCAAQATLNTYATQNYANSATCSNPNPPQCTAEATVSSATTGENVTVKKCSYDTVITLNYANGEADPTTTTQNYYCYSYNNDSTTPLPACSLNTSDVVITPCTPPSGSLSTALPALSIPNVITDINGAGATAPRTTTSSAAQGIRSKTVLEQGLCANVPPLPDCAAITVASSSTNYATWDSAAPGVQSTGHCMAGYIPISATSLLRYCLISPENASSGNAPTPNFETLTSSMGCKPPTCPAVTTLSVNDGYAFWQGTNSDGSTTLDQQATGSCAGGTLPPVNGLAQRTCELNSSYVAVLSPVDSTTTCTQIPWQMGLVYPASGSLTASSDPNATATYYISDFLSSSTTVSAYLANINVQYDGGPSLKHCPGPVPCSQAIFVPGPQITTPLTAGQTLTIYINIPAGSLAKIAKIAYIDNVCSSGGNTTNCTWTSNLGATHASSLLGTAKSPPSVILSGAQGTNFKKLFDLYVTPAGQSSSFVNPGFGPFKWFGWDSQGFGGYDGWMIYSTTNIDDNVTAATNTLGTGLNKVQLVIKPGVTITNTMYPNSLGFWYIELQQSVFPQFETYDACE